VNKQLDLEVEGLAERIYTRHHADRSINVPWVRRCETIKDGYRATARRALLSRVSETA
jgi:hypothetical protein